MQLWTSAKRLANRALGRAEVVRLNWRQALQPNNTSKPRPEGVNKRRLLIISVLLSICAAFIYVLSFPSPRLDCSVSSVGPDAVVFSIHNPSAKGCFIQVFVQSLQGTGWQAEKHADSGALEYLRPDSFTLFSVAKPPGAVKWRAVFHYQRSLNRTEKKVLSFAIRLGVRPSWYTHTLVSEVIE